MEFRQIVLVASVLCTIVATIGFFESGATVIHDLNDNSYYKYTLCTSLNLTDSCLHTVNEGDDVNKYVKNCEVTASFVYDLHYYEGTLNTFRSVPYNDIKTTYAPGNNFTCYVDTKALNKPAGDITIVTMAPVVSAMAIVTIVCLGLAIAGSIFPYKALRTYDQYQSTFVPTEEWVMHVRRMWNSKAMHPGLKIYVWALIGEMFIGIGLQVSGLVFMDLGFVPIFVISPITFGSVLFLPWGIMDTSSRRNGEPAPGPVDPSKEFKWKRAQCIFILLHFCISTGLSVATCVILFILAVIDPFSHPMVYFCLIAPSLAIVVTRWWFLKAYNDLVPEAFRYPRTSDQQVTPADTTLQVSTEADDLIPKEDEEDPEMASCMSRYMMRPENTQEQNMVIMKGFFVPILVFSSSAMLCGMLYALAIFNISSQGLLLLAIVNCLGVWCTLAYRPTILSWLYALQTAAVVIEVILVIISCIYEDLERGLVSPSVALLTSGVSPYYAIYCLKKYYRQRFPFFGSRMDTRGRSQIGVIVLLSLLGMFQTFASPLALVISTDFRIGYWSIWFFYGGIATYALCFGYRRAPNSFKMACIVVNLALVVEQLCMIVYYTRFEHLANETNLYAIVLSFILSEVLSCIVAFNSMKSEPSEL